MLVRLIGFLKENCESLWGIIQSIFFLLKEYQISSINTSLNKWHVVKFSRDIYLFFRLLNMIYRRRNVSKLPFGLKRQFIFIVQYPWVFFDGKDKCRSYAYGIFLRLVYQIQETVEFNLLIQLSRISTDQTFKSETSSSPCGQKN